MRVVRLEKKDRETIVRVLADLILEASKGGITSLALSWRGPATKEGPSSMFVGDARSLYPEVSALAADMLDHYRKHG